MESIQTKIKHLFDSDQDVEYLAETDDSTFHGIAAGAVFIHCSTSAPSARSFISFADVISRIDTERLLKIRVIDTDSIHPVFNHPLIRNELGGWGEVAWVKNSDVVFAAIGKDAPDQFEQHALKLLAEIA